MRMSHHQEQNQKPHPLKNQAPKGAPLARESCCSLVKDNTQEGIVDVDLAVVLDEAQFPEFVHEKIDPGPRGANHLRQHLLRYFGKHLLRMASRAVVREQQQSARQPLLAGVE